MGSELFTQGYRSYSRLQKVGIWMQGDLWCSFHSFMLGSRTVTFQLSGFYCRDAYQLGTAIPESIQNSRDLYQLTWLLKSGQFYGRNIIVGFLL